MATISEQRVIRLNELAKRLGVARVTLWRWERKGLLPPKICYGPNSTGWLVSTIDQWWAEKSGEAPGAESRHPAPSTKS